MFLAGAGNMYEYFAWRFIHSPLSAVESQSWAVGEVTNPPAKLSGSGRAELLGLCLCFYLSVLSACTLVAYLSVCSLYVCPFVCLGKRAKRQSIRQPCVLSV